MTIRSPSRPSQESVPAFTADNARFFTEPLPGRDAPLDSPGAAAKPGPIGADTDLVANHPPQGD